MKRAVYSLYQELIREARECGVPSSVLMRLNNRMNNISHGNTDGSEVIIPLIREIEKRAKGEKRESILDSMRRKRDRFSKLQREIAYGGK